jgi:hypothetical protein
LGLKRKLRFLFSDTVEIENQSFSSSDSEGIVAEETVSKPSLEKLLATPVLKKQDPIQ